MNRSDFYVGRALLARWVPDWDEEDIGRISMLSDGPMSSSWRVDVGGHAFVVKRRATNPLVPGTSLAREVQVLGQVAPRGLGPMLSR